MTTTIVSTTAGLKAALESAQAGDVIKLAPGVYAPAKLANLSFDGPVTITSLDPHNAAQLTGLNVKDSQGLSFSNLEFVVNSSTDYPFQVNGSKNISFDRLDVHGSLDGDVQNDVAGMWIRTSEDVTVTNSEFHELRHGILHLDNKGVTVSGNHFHDIRTDGVRGGGSSEVTISDNYFTDFYPAEGEHADAIQFWTTNTKQATRDIVVEGNVVLRGSGDPIQGVFFRDEVGNLAYQNVTVSDNLVVGGLYHGITVGGANNVTVSGNAVVGLPDQKSWLNVDSSINVKLTGNIATDLEASKSAGLTASGNSTIAVPSDGGKAFQQAWFAEKTSLLNTAMLLKSVSTMLGGVINANTLTIDTLNAAAEAALRVIEEARAQTITIVGTSGSDRLGTDDARNTIIDAGAGDDILTGGGVGHNTLAGGDGDDTYYVKSVFDVIHEAQDAGKDLAVASVDFTLPEHVETLRMVLGATYGAGNGLDNRITGTATADEIWGFGGADTLQGVGGDDQIRGGDGDDVIVGGDGADTLAGDAGDDKLSGSEGNDSLSGGLGADTLEGNVGADTMSGGEGADMFFFRNGDLSLDPDVIVDFSREQGDRISLSMVDANVNVAGDQKFTWLGTSGFNHVAGEARYEVVGGQAHVWFDVNGDGAADMGLVVGTTTLQGSDFLL